MDYNYNDLMPITNIDSASASISTITINISPMIEFKLSNYKVPFFFSALAINKVLSLQEVIDEFTK